MRRVAIKVPTSEAMAQGAIVLACAALAGLSMAAAAPTAVLAQEAIPTATGALGEGAPPAPESGPLRLSDRIDEGPDVLRPVGPCGGPARKEDGKPDKSPHGEVWAGIGTHGYRDIGGVVCAPLVDNAAVSIAVDAGQINGWGRRR
jgi:hypothetical protein